MSWVENRSGLTPISTQHPPRADSTGPQPSHAQSAPWETEWRITLRSHTHKGLFTFPVTSFLLGTVDTEAVLPSRSSRKNKGWPAFIYIYGKAYEQESTSGLLPHSNIQMQFENGATETYLQRPVFCLKIKCESITLGYSSPPVHRWLTSPELLLQHFCVWAICPINKCMLNTCYVWGTIATQWVAWGGELLLVSLRTQSEGG